MGRKAEKNSAGSGQPLLRFGGRIKAEEAAQRPYAIMDKPSADAHKPEIEALLAHNPLIAGACELDLLVFLYRHPRTLLTNEQLAVFAGYDMKEVAGAIDAFIEVGLLERTTQGSLHAARMYRLLLEGPQTGGLKTLLDLASTRQGRQDILQILSRGRSGPEVDAKKTHNKRRLRAIA